MRDNRKTQNPLGRILAHFTSTLPGALARFLSMLAAMCLIAAFGAASPGNCGQEGGPDKLHYIKAAFVYNFAKFIEWPDSQEDTSDKPMVLCILGKGPINAAFDSLKGKKLHNRPLKVQHVSEAKDAKGCHILFVTSSEKKKVKRVLDTFAENPVLTIGDMEGFVSNGGVIELVMDERRIRFDINIKAAKKAELTISSRLLKLARKIIR